jgi:hypothetical protein
LQVVAIILYPLAFIQQSPQAAVLPPALLLLFVLFLAGMNTGVLTPLAGRVSLVFVQGINIVVRTIMLLPNLRAQGGGWNWANTVFMLLGIAISWFVIIRIEQYPPRLLLFVQKDLE